MYRILASNYCVRLDWLLPLNQHQIWLGRQETSRRSTQIYSPCLESVIVCTTVWGSSQMKKLTLWVRENDIFDHIVTCDILLNSCFALQQKMISRTSWRHIGNFVQLNQCSPSYIIWRITWSLSSDNGMLVQAWWVNTAVRAFTTYLTVLEISTAIWVFRAVVWSTPFAGTCWVSIQTCLRLQCLQNEGRSDTSGLILFLFFSAWPLLFAGKEIL